MPRKTPMSEFDNDLCRRIFFSMPGLTDTDIGKIINLRRQTIQGWRSGKSRPTLNQLNIITQNTSISWEWFITGKTSDYISVAHTFFPIYYDKKHIASAVLHKRCREIAIMLLATTNSRLFLPLLSAFEHAALGLFDLPNIDKMIDININTTEIVNIFSEIKVPKKYLSGTTLTYKKMLDNYTPLQNFSSKFYPNSQEGQIPKTQKHSKYQVIAYTSTNSYLDKANSDPCIDFTNTLFCIKGEDMNPIIRNNQNILLGPAIQPSSLTDAKGKIVVAKITTNNKFNSSSHSTLHICRYANYINNQLLLTTPNCQSEPYCISEENIQYVLPLVAILYST